MKLLVKTLVGGKFEIEVKDSDAVSEVKKIIENVKSDLPAAQMKLIKSGKVLKDEDVLADIGVKENDFLVVMITKTKKAAAAPAPVAPSPAETPKTPAAESTEGAPPAAASTPAAATTTATSTPVAPPAPSSSAPEFPPDAIAGLRAMGFPEEEVLHCLRAAQGNPDLAVEFLTNGIPEGISVNSAAATPAATTSSLSSSSTSSQPLQALRNHPQFNDLRRLVQSNPQMLQQVLSQIGQQQPELLREINANQALFLQMMNEPVSSTPAPAPSSSAPASSGGGDAGGLFGMEGLGGPGNPAQMAEMINRMSQEELQQMSQMMGLTPEQLRATAHMIGQMPPEQLQQFMGQVMGGAGGTMGGGGAGGPQVLRLTDEEMAAVDRLTEMGFDRAEAAQAFLACDKNEALAANLLMDSMGDGGFFAGGGGNPGGGNNNNDGSNGGSNDNDDNNQGGDDDEDMYD